MTVKELKEYINLIPDDFVLGLEESHTYYENWEGERRVTSFKKFSDINVDLKNKKVKFK